MKHNASNARLTIGSFSFPETSISSAKLSEKRNGSHVFTEAEVRVLNPDSFRWDYRANTELRLDGQLQQSGVCLRAKRTEKNELLIELFDGSWRLKHMPLRPSSFFGMSAEEIVYWLVQLSGFSAKPPVVPGLSVDKEVRPFIYAVPLIGISASGPVSLSIGDVGVVAGEHDNMFSPLVEALGDISKDLPEWAKQVPKAYGVVLAKSPLEADQMGLKRAQMTADILNFSIRFGASHFEDRHAAVSLDWNAESVEASVRLGTSILVQDATAQKGWVRSQPFVGTQASVEWDGIQNRAKFFFEKFLSSLTDGDTRDQQGERIISKRERELAGGLRRALKWFGISSNQDDIDDKFIAAWVALEAVLDCMEYPGIFAGERGALGERLRAGVREAFKTAPRTDSELLALSPDFFENRLRQGNWPMKRKLKIFAASFGIDITRRDLELIGSLARRRARVLHGSYLESQVSPEEIRELSYLIERLIAAASIHAYRDVEEREEPPAIVFGEVGPNGGAAPLFLDGNEVPYRLLIRGTNVEILAAGKVFERFSGPRNVEKPEGESTPG